jgi:hypothetical protein
MDVSEDGKKQDCEGYESAENSHRKQIISALERIAEQNQATENQAQRADTFHRRVERLTLRLEGRKFWLELAETIGLWVAAGVGVAAIIISSHDSERQTRVMQAQQVAMQGQLDEMKGTSAQTDQMLETNRKLAEAAGTQAQAAINSAKTAQDNMVASQRAWIGPRNAKSVTGPELEKNLDVVVEYQNTGREPALETIFDAEVFVATKEEDDSGAVSSRINNFIGKCKVKWTPMKKGVVFPSGGTGSAYELTKTLDVSEIDQDVVDGSKSIIVDGCFVYKSAGGIRRSSFCYFFTGKKTKPTNWSICEVGNDAD